MLEKLFSGGLPAQSKAVIESWGSGAVITNPAVVLQGIFESQSRETYDRACAMTFEVLRKRFNTPRDTHVHIWILPGWQFVLASPIRAGEDTLQQQGLAAIHPIPETQIQKPEGDL
jgi:hypothetical protein